MHGIIIATIIALLAVPAFAAEEVKTENQKTLYAIGLAVGRQMSVYSFTSEELEFVLRGINDEVTGKKPMVDLDSYSFEIQELTAERRKARADKLNAATKEFIGKVAKEKGAVKTASGMVYVSLKEGSGPSPVATDKVTVQYRGTLVDGNEFDSSYTRGQPGEFPLGGLIKCWIEGLQMMKVGGKAKLVCPAEIAYGEKGVGGFVPPNATLIFEIELLGVKK
jgi:FKBP-type peptidyl-prolyl cis-trans isomerase FkpA